MEFFQFSFLKAGKTLKIQVANTEVSFGIYWNPVHSVIFCFEKKKEQYAIPENLKHSFSFFVPVL